MGLGTDVVEIARIASQLDKSQRLAAAGIDADRNADV